MGVRISVNYLVDIYPFKFELKDVIYRHLSQNSQNMNQTKMDTQHFLFAYMLLYHKKADKEKIKKYLKQTGKSYYLTRLNEKQQGYLDSLSDTFYSYQMNDEDETTFGDIVGLTSVKTQSEVYHVYSVVEKHFKNHPLGVSFYFKLAIYFSLDKPLSPT